MLKQIIGLVLLFSGVIITVTASTALVAIQSEWTGLLFWLGWILGPTGFVLLLKGCEERDAA